MKVIFLDVDGVLNYATPQKLKGWVAWPRPDCLQYLKQIVAITGAKIVVHSHWRLSPTSFNLLTGALNRVGLEIFDVTPEIDKNKIVEIKTYLAWHTNITNFVILEDDDLGLDLKKHQIRTIPGIGLTKEHIEEAIKILNE